MKYTYLSNAREGLVSGQCGHLNTVAETGRIVLDSSPSVLVAGVEFAAVL